MEPPRSPPSLREAIEVWALISGQSFGGAAGQIGVLHRVLVEERRWLGEERFLHALHACMLLPGSEAQQLLTYVGWLSHGYRGGLIAGALFVLPGFVTILTMSAAYAMYHQIPAVAAAFWGVEAAVLAVLFEAGIRIGRRVLTRPSTVLTALAAFVALFFLEVPFPAVILVAGLLGAFGARWFPAPTPPTPAGGTVRPLLDALLDDDRLPHVHPSPGRDLAVAGAILAAWLLPTAVLWATLGGDHPLSAVGRFFSSAAVVSFGGAYGVLAYVAQQAVEVHGWLVPRELLDGLGLAETAPGPRIQVMQFFGFLATYRDPGPLHPLVAGVLGAGLTAWVTFAPSFLFVLAGGPYVERIRRFAALSSALRAITAAGVGVVVNLAVWLTLHVWFAAVTETRAGPLRLLVPDLDTVRWLGVGITVAAVIGLLRVRLQLTLVLMVGALVGLVAWMLGA